MVRKDEFRKNKRGHGHPSWVFEKQGRNLKSFDITHTAEYQGVKNIPLSKNPNPRKQDEKAYFIKDQITQHESHYGRKYKDYSLPRKDKRNMERYKK